MYIFGWGLFLGLFGLFATFFYQGYMDSVTQKFLTLQASAGICNQVLKPLTGSFYGDSNGNWEGSADFSYVNVLYKFTLQNMKATPDWFRDGISCLEINPDGYVPMEYVMKNVYGQLATTQNLAQNLLVWFTLSIYSNVGGSIQIFEMAGHPHDVYSQQMHSGGVGDYHSDCTAPSLTNFDQGSSKLTLRYNYNEFINNNNCSRLFDPILFGYSSLYHGNEFSIQFDVRSLVVAAGINIRLSVFENLIAVPGYAQVFDDLGKTMYIDKYYDARYAGMVCGACNV